MNSKPKSGYDHQYRTHFDAIVTDYDKTRPEYPSELYTDLFNFTKPASGKKALEIGAGTGKATTPFLDAGYDVTAVEIGANMSDFLKEKFAAYKNFNVITAAFEDVDLQENTYDLIYSATAFHWVDKEVGCPKVFRLLKDDGVFANFRYNYFPADSNALHEDIQAVYEKYYYSHYQKNLLTLRKPDVNLHDPDEILRRTKHDELHTYGFKDVTMKLYESQVTSSVDEHLASLDTFSDHINLPDENRAALYAGIKEVTLRHGGYRTADMVYQLYMGRK